MTIQASESLLFIVSLIAIYFTFADDFIVSLLPPEEFDYDIFLRQHLDEVNGLLKGNYVKKTFPNLVDLGFVAYSITLQPEHAMILQKMDGVKFIEPVGDMTIAGSSLISPLFIRPEQPVIDSHVGFCTIDHEMYTTQQKTKSNMSLPSIDVFVLDTGIQTSHASFGGRAVHGIDLISPDQPIEGDPHGHGTQVAGIIGGERYGVNTRTRLVDVRVMGADGRGRVDVILAGLDHVVGSHRASSETQGPLNAVACLSMTGPPSQAMRYALFYLSKALIVVAAMGDSDSFSCSVSPALSPFALTVGGIDRSANYLTGSNYGGCVDIYAPGEDILGPWIGVSNTEEHVLTGTSASAAIVAGLVAIVMSTLRSPELTYTTMYTKISSTLYARLTASVSAEGCVTVVRNILLASWDNTAGPCRMFREEIGGGGGDSFVYHSAKKMLQDIDSEGRPSVFQRLKAKRIEKQRGNVESFYRT